MRIAYFDVFSGISGDMTIGAFLDAGLSFYTLSRELAKLKVKGYKLKTSRVKRGGLVGTKFDCVVDDDPRDQRSLKEIINIIEKSSLNKRVKKIAKAIFLNIGTAEAKIHGVGAESDAHLHELGDIDSIVDIVGTAIAIDELGIEEIYSSRISLGRTFVSTREGNLPIPAPASLELLKGAPIKISDNIDAELVTPTGAGILKALTRSFGDTPQMKIDKIGYGVGTRVLKEGPNMLRVMIGEKIPIFKEDRIYVIETNIDDMSPQNFEYIMERLFKEGALDVYTAGIQMKKSRPAFKLTVLAQPQDLMRLSSVIFSETTTIGMRYYETARFKLERRSVKVKTKYGDVNVKLGSSRQALYTASPEYEECVRLAKEKKVPLKLVYDEAKKAVKV